MTEFVEVKVSELEGAALDWAVAKADGVAVRVLSADNPAEKWQVQKQWRGDGPYWPSRDWSQGGPLIERFKCQVLPNTWPGGLPWLCWLKTEGVARPLDMHGETVLIATCRAIVSAKLGDTVSVPKELMP